MLAWVAAIAVQVAAVIPTPVPTAAASPADDLAQLEQVYREGCEVRAYGTYGDMCTSLADQITQFRRQMRRDEAQRLHDQKAAPTPPKPAQTGPNVR